MVRLIDANLAIKAIDEHTKPDGTLDDDITCILENIPPAMDADICRFLAGEWCDCEKVQDALGMDFKQCFAVFDFCRTAEWWSIAGKTEEEKKRQGQKIVTCFKIKKHHATKNQ